MKIFKLALYLLAFVVIIVSAIGLGMAGTSVYLAYEMNKNAVSTASSLPQIPRQMTECEKLEKTYEFASRRIINQIMEDYSGTTRDEAAIWLEQIFSTDWQYMDLSQNLNVKLNLFESQHESFMLVRADKNCV